MPTFPGETDGVCPASVARIRENSQTEMDDCTDTTEDGAEATRERECSYLKTCWTEKSDRTVEQ